MDENVSPTDSTRITGARRLAILSRRAVLFAGLWWAFAEGRADSLGFGVLMVALALGVTARLPTPRPWRWTLAGLAGFVPYFVYHSILSGVDIARRALAPRPDIDPHVMVLPFYIAASPARLFITHVVSLMPGTLSMAIEDDTLRLHALAGKAPAVERDFRELERRIARLFGLSLSETPPRTGAPNP